MEKIADANDNIVMSVEIRGSQSPQNHVPMNAKIAVTRPSTLADCTITP